jgi:hypothetical protein
MLNVVMLNVVMVNVVILSVVAPLVRVPSPEGGYNILIFRLLCKALPFPRIDFKMISRIKKNYWTNSFRSTLSWCLLIQKSEQSFICKLG